MARREDGDRGASAMEWALLTPVLILVLLAVVQFAMIYHARQVALAAAQAGARVARTQPDGDWRGQAVAKAGTDVRQIGPRLIEGLRIDAGQDGDERWVQVSGTAVRVVPFLKVSVTQRSQGPIECFRPDVGSGTTCEAPR
ncbi:TadE/TadG family type IV pilus assembly protein [Actinomadura atramentaria]|uniref:TadE/TadG family type IV pilus assembly protein n=1 Tax=Actinomadura atramentaria TaxID=1990 RepID=UPI00037E2772|nr:TadE/TadG family type IV pilus assembly protein [Actinomadura atramentaria]